MNSDNKHILAFHHSLVDVDGFEALLSGFIDNGYKVSSFNVEQEPDFHLHSLPAMLGDMFDSLDSVRIVIVSNIRTAILSWFRICNRMADYIYFIDLPSGGNYIETVERSVFDRLASFVEIYDEKLDGKIFINLAPANYTLFAGFVLSNDNYRFFEPIDTFDYDKAVNCDKHPSDVSYLHNGRTYSFNPKGNDNTLALDLDAKPKPISGPTDISRLPAWCLLPALIAGVSIPSSEITGRGVAERRRFCADMGQISPMGFSFPAYCKFAITMIFCNIDNDMVVRRLMELLIADNDNLHSHFSILIFFYFVEKSPKLYNEYYIHYRQELDKLAKFVRKHQKIKSSPDLVRKKAGILSRSHLKAIRSIEAGFHPPIIYEHNNPLLDNKKKNHWKKIAFIVHRLADIKYSPTSVILKDILLLVEAVNTEAVLIVVEDVYVSKIYSDDISPQFKVTTPPTHSNVVAALDPYFNEISKMTNLEIIVSNVDKPRLDRINFIVSKVRQFAPDILASECPESVTARILYDEYPTIQFAFNTEYTYAYSDCYFVASIKTMQNYNAIYGGLIQDNTLQEYLIPLEVPAIVSEISRTVLAGSDDDILVITPNNRLHTEMDHIFIDMMAEIITRSPQVQWILVGTARPEDYFFERCTDLINSGRIRYRGYEPDIMALLKVCDIYVQPTSAIGGGLTLYYAMTLAMPIVLMGGYFSDGIITIGEENASGTTLEEYAIELERLLTHEKYRATKGQQFYQRSTFFSRTNAYESLAQGVNLAMRNFDARMNAKN
jgi:hypothetical protein